VQWVEEVAAEVKEVTQHLRRPPGLAVVLVGSRPDSLLYVTRKKETCVKAGGYNCLLQEELGKGS
jgi:5,10-methylene-tetrahydrofolate dehydrogenase/methenyl tetrahydrofolate cyclohydrolase